MAAVPELKLPLTFVGANKQHKKTRKLLRRLAYELEIIVTASFDRAQAALAGISGDITALTGQVGSAQESAEAARAAAADLKLQLDEALANQEPATQEQIKAAVAEATANLEAANRTLQSQLAQIADTAEALDARTPNAVAPTDPEDVPVETPNVPETDTLPSNPVPAPETPVEEPVIENGDDSVPADETPAEVPADSDTFPGTQEPQIDPQDDEPKPLPVTP